MAQTGVSAVQTMALMPKPEAFNIAYWGLMR